MNALDLLKLTDVLEDDSLSDCSSTLNSLSNISHASSTRPFARSTSSTSLNSAEQAVMDPTSMASIISAHSRLYLRESRMETDSALDICRISDRLLIASRCWQSELFVSPLETLDSLSATLKNKPNNAQNFASFLNKAFRGGRYTLWNVGPPESFCAPSLFNYQIVPYTLPRRQHFTLKQLFHLCHSIMGWLHLSSSNVAVIQCEDGWRRSGLVVACLLRFVEAFDSAFEAMEFVLKRRRASLRGVHEEVSLATEPTIRRYLRYFNDCLVLSGRVPNSLSLNLHQLIVTTIPDCDGSGGCQPALDLFLNNELVYSSESHSSSDNEDLIFQDDNHIIFRLRENCLLRDVTIHIFHCNQYTRQRTTISTVSFNAGFAHPGVIRLRSADLEMPCGERGPAALKRVDPEFSVDLILLPGEKSSESVPMDYISSCRNNPLKNLLRFCQLHGVRPDRLLVRSLELQGHHPMYARLSLQLHNNDIHRAHEWLEAFKGSKVKCGLDTILEGIEKKVNDSNATKAPVVGALYNLVDRAEYTQPNAEKLHSDRRSPQIDLRNEIHANVRDEHIAKITRSPQKPIVTEPSTRPDDTASKLLTPPEAAVSESFAKSEVIDFAPLPTAPDAIPPAPAPAPPPPPPGLAPPAPALAPPPEQLLVRSKSLPRIKNSLHWNEVRGNLEKSIWYEFERQPGAFETIKLDVQAFEELFCVLPTQKEAANGPSSGAAVSEDTFLPPAVPVVIDIRRANNVGIGLARFYKRFSDEEALTSAIYSHSELMLDDLMTLKSILPTLEEQQALRLVEGPIDRLGKAERFMYLVSMQGGKRIELALSVKILETAFEADLNGILGQFRRMQQVLEKLIASDKLKLILKGALDLGNLANYQYGRRRTSARGFTLDSLTRLHEVKSVDGSCNLLTFLLENLLDGHPELAELPDDFGGELEALRHISSNHLRVELEELARTTRGLHEEVMDTLAAMEEQKKLLADSNCSDSAETFFTQSRDRLQGFAAVLEEGHRLSSSFAATWQRTLEYFGESKDIGNGNGIQPSEMPGTMLGDASVLFGTMHHFLKHFSSALRQIERRKRAKDPETEADPTEEGEAVAMSSCSPTGSGSTLDLELELSDDEFGCQPDP